MDFVQLTDKGLNEGLVEDDISEVFPLRLLENLWLQEQVALLSNLVFQILAHQIGQERANLELNIPRHRAHDIIIEVQVLLYLLIDGLLRLLLAVHPHELALHVGARGFLGLIIAALGPGVEHCRSKLAVEELAELVEELDGGDLDLLGLVAADLGVGQVDLVLVVPDVVDELPEQVLHQVQHAQRRDLLGRHLDQVVADLGLLRVQVPPLYEDLLLLGDGILQQLHPGDDVAVRHRELVGSPNLDQLVEGLPILGLRELEGKLLDLQLTLEQIHWVFLARLRDPVDGDAVLVQAEGCLAHLVVKLVDLGVDLTLEGLELVALFLLHFFHFVFYKGFHVLWVCERELLLQVRYLRSRSLTKLVGVILEHISINKLRHIDVRSRVVDLLLELNVFFPVVFLHEKEILLKVLVPLVGRCVDHALL